MSDENVVSFPKLQGKPLRPLVKAKRYPIKCNHGEFIVDPKLSTVECGKCGEKLNPIWVLAQFADKDSNVRRQFAMNEALAEETKSKTKCKCEHCGQMTSTANRQETNRAWNNRTIYD